MQLAKNKFILAFVCSITLIPSLSFAAVHYQLGASGAGVRQFQTQLVTLGYLTQDNATGYYGAITKAAVQEFQRENGLSSSNPNTEILVRLFAQLKILQAKLAEIIASAKKITDSTSSSTPLADLHMAPIQATTTPYVVTVAPNTSTQDTTCAFDGKNVPDGQSVTAYRYTDVPVDHTCISESRICTHGVLSGSYTHAACTRWVPPLFATRTTVGLGEPIIGNTVGKSWNLDTQLDTIINLKPATFRLWVYAVDNPAQPDPTVPLYTKAIDRLAGAGIQVVGMLHGFHPWMNGGDINTPENVNVGLWELPCPESAAAYNQFLDRYEIYVRNLAKMFPKVTMWEPLNETNVPGKLKPPQSGAGSCGKVAFTASENIQINLDLMYRAHRAVKSVNQNALVFMPPAAPPFSSITQFVSDIYTGIAARGGSPRDYFDAVSWHPYIWQAPNDANWVAANQSVYAIMQAHGDGSIPVIFTEVGNDGRLGESPEVLAAWMRDTFILTQDTMPWVTSITWFRTFAGVGSAAEGDPYSIIHNDYPAFTHKPSADTFCTFSGCVNGRFRAFVQNSGWAMFWLNGKYYCQITPESYAASGAQDYSNVLAQLPAIDPTKKVYVGMCTGHHQDVPE